jgi:hypothetical protein
MTLLAAAISEAKADQMDVDRESARADVSRRVDALLDRALQYGNWKSI